MVYSFENASFRDKETGLYSEAYFMEVFYREWHRMIRENHALSILVVHPNLDMMNPTGKQKFLQLAHLIDASTKRTTDLVSRFHNNEFIVGLFDLSCEGTTTIINRILSAISEQNEQQQVTNCSAFIGGLNVHPTRDLDICKVLEQVESLTTFNARQSQAENAFELQTLN